METSPSTDHAAQVVGGWVTRCEALLADAARWSGAGSAAAAHVRLLHRAGDLRDDIDEALLPMVRATVDPCRRPAVTGQQRRFEARIASLPPHLRGLVGRARCVAGPSDEASR